MEIKIDWNDLVDQREESFLLLGGGRHKSAANLLSVCGWLLHPRNSHEAVGEGVHGEHPKQEVVPCGNTKRFVAEARATNEKYRLGFRTRYCWGETVMKIEIKVFSTSISIGNCEETRR